MPTLPFTFPQTNCGYNLGNVAKSVITRGWEKKGLGFPQALKEPRGEWVMDGGYCFFFFFRVHSDLICIFTEGLLLCLNLRSKCLSHVYIILDWDSMCKFDIKILKIHDMMGMYLRNKKKLRLWSEIYQALFISYTNGAIPNTDSRTCCWYRLGADCGTLRFGGMGISKDLDGDLSLRVYSY